MKIDILCGSGSPNGIVHSDIFGVDGRIGVGGAELALLTLCEGWKKRGHEVVLYNNPRRNDGIIEQRHASEFDKFQNRDVVIFFREPSPKAVECKGLKIFWSCDQYTQGDFSHFSNFVDKVVTISLFHTEYFKTVYNIHGAIDIDLPVRTWEYSTLEKVPSRLIFTSVPDRGLELVAKMFPALKEAVPDLSLVITSDYRLWGSWSPDNQAHVQRFMHMQDVQFLGAVTRKQLIQEQLQAQIHFYPFSARVEELFCIAVAESQVAGVLPITPSAGALGTTNMGVLIQGNPREKSYQDVMIQTTIRYLQDVNLPSIQRDLREKATERFSLDRILDEWDSRVFNAI